MKKLLPILFLFMLTGCSFISSEEKFSVSISEAGVITEVETLPGITVDQLLRENNISINPLDKVNPPLITSLAGGELILISRVTEEFSVIESVVPFEQQTIKNESLSEGNTVLIQSGVNGRKQSTYRVLYEDGLEVSRTLVKEDVVQPAKPEILMIGVQSPFSAVEIDGTIAYISSSNAWIMDINTGNRKVVASSGDLDGRVFSLSFDRKWLLFSRSADDPDDDQINSLWLVDITKEEMSEIDTGVRNVVHFADWVPGKNRTFAYSTVEPRATAPGWQANNDLHLYSFDVDGEKDEDTILVEPNSGGIYGWWGTSFQYSPDGKQLAYARPDSIGLVDIKTGEMESILDFDPYEPKTDWAWVPGIQWSDDGLALYTVQKMVISNGTNAENFNLIAILIDSKRVLPLVERCGLFCYPVPSSNDQSGKFLVGYLTAILPDQSETSRYNLYVMDRDGSNRKKLFPGEGQQGLDPQFVGWSPLSGNSVFRLVFTSQGNIMFADLPSGLIKQITGDGTVSKVIWR